MILVDTSVIVAWLDKSHLHHRASLKAIAYYAEHETLAVSSVTYVELAAGGRTRQAVDKDLRDFEKIPLEIQRRLARGHGISPVLEERFLQPGLAGFLYWRAISCDESPPSDK